MNPYTEHRARFPASIRARLDSHYGVLGSVLIVYFISSFFSVTLERYAPPGPDQWAKQFNRHEWVVMSRPRVLRGDEMHYLLMANSLARDGDLRLSADYANVLRGGLDMGFWHRRFPVRDPQIHFTRMNDVAHGQFSLIGKHPFGFSAVLAVLLWPLAGSSWMEAACIWVTVLAAIVGLHFFLRILEDKVEWQFARNATLLLAFATPYWSYARTLYTETWVSLGYLIVIYCALRSRALRELPLLGVLAWFKYTALLMFLSAGAGEWLRGRKRNFVLVGTFGSAMLAAIYFFNRTFYYRAGFMVFGGIASAPVRAGLGAPIAWIPGNPFKNLMQAFFDPEKGLLPFSPLLVFALWSLFSLRRYDRYLFSLVLWCVIPWFLVHISYQYLMVGESYTVRYFVPLIPIVMIALPWWSSRAQSRRSRVLYLCVCGWSLACNSIAGILPALAFSHRPTTLFRGAAKVAWALVFGSRFQ